MSTKRRPSLVVQGPVASLTKFTNARIALGHSGQSLPTQPLLDFQLAHARARDAVHSALDFTQLAKDVHDIGLHPVCVKSRAESRESYLRQPNLGRQLASDSARIWQEHANASSDKPILLVIGDGLSAQAIRERGVKLLALLAEALSRLGVRAEVPLVAHARVAIADELASIARAKLVLHLIGERPGLSSAENISIYLTYQPTIGTTDEVRNCISNIGGPGGLTLEEAARKAAYLTQRALSEGRSGISLKDEQN